MGERGARQAGLFGDCSRCRCAPLSEFLLSRSLGVKLIQLPVSLVEGMLVVEPTNINRLEVLVEKQTLRIVRA